MHNPAIRRKQVNGVLRLVGQFSANGGTLVVSGFEQGGNPMVSRHQFFEFFDAEGRLLQMKFAFFDSKILSSLSGRSCGFLQYKLSKTEVRGFQETCHAGGNFFSTSTVLNMKKILPG
ncbi:MAG: hypothetical protein ACREOO_32025 [bacterium]